MHKGIDDTEKCGYIENSRRIEQREENRCKDEQRCGQSAAVSLESETETADAADGKGQREDDNQIAAENKKYGGFGFGCREENDERIDDCENTG